MMNILNISGYADGTMVIYFVIFIINKTKIIIYFSGFIYISQFIYIGLIKSYVLTDIDESTEIYDYFNFVDYIICKIDIYGG